MSTTVKIGTCVLGEGMPKICAPIVGRSIEEICRQAEDVKKARPDMAEWRMDFLDGIEEEQIQSEALKRVSELLDGLPLLCTFRTKAEGGEKAKVLYERFVELLKESNLKVETGEFGAHMKVDIQNDGPVTLMLDSKKNF